MAEAPHSTHQPYVPAGSTMLEFSLRALVLGLIMSVVLGAANAYLGLKAGMTIAVRENLTLLLSVFKMKG